MGKGGGGGNFNFLRSPLVQEAIDASQFQRGIASTLFSESTPTRQAAFPLVESSLDNFNAPISIDTLAQNPQFGAFKDAIETQFDSARQRALESIPTGGGLFDALGGVERGRAGALTQGFGALASDEAQQRQRNLDRALGVATGVPQVALGGAQGAGATFANLAGQQAQIANAQAQADSQKSGSFGQALGTVVAAGKGGGGPSAAKAGITPGLQGIFT